MSELARHLILPDGIVTTGWPAVAAQLDRLDLPLDRWQQGWVEAILAKRADGKYACGVGGAVASIPRQAGKTYTLGALVFALCLAQPGMLVLWSAHRARTHNETFKSMDGMAQRPKVAPFVSEVRKGSGEQEIAFNNGSRILFGARERGFGRGFAKVDVVVLDEAQILTESAMEDMVPATNAADNGLVVLIGTPPRPRDPGEVFQMLRDGALSGDETDVLYVEFSADDDAKLDDREQWKVANPSFPGRTSETAILRMRKLLGSDEPFRREALGIWDKASLGSAGIVFSQWDVLKIPQAEVPVEGRKVFAVVFAWDGSGIGLAAAIRPDDGGPVHVDPIRQAPLGEGTQWLVDWLLERHRDAAQIVIYGKGQTEGLINALRDGGARSKKLILTPSFGQMLEAHGMFEQAIKNGSLTHLGLKPLNAQVKDVVKQKLGNQGGFGWASRSDQSVVLLEAVTFAHWGARVTKRNPNRRAVVKV